MSIADKITSIEGHLADDYEGLENLGADLTNVNKNIQNIRTCLDNIYTSLPKTTGEGSNLSLSTIKGRINVDDILGDTSQDSTTGKNLLKIVGTTQTINGLTFTQNNDGSISVSGTATATTNYVSTEPQPITPSLRYRLSGCPPTGSSTTYRVLLRVRSDLTTNIATISQVGNGEVSDGRLTAPSNAYYVLGEIQVYSGQTINKTFYPQLEEIASVDAPATSYEPYTGGTASPNPTYPQPINVVTGQQEVLVRGKNLFGDTLRSGVTNYQTGAYSSNATRLTSTNWTFLKAGTYTISAKNSASKTLQISNITFDKDNNYYEVSGVSGQWKNLPYTITLPQDTNWKCNIEFSDASTIQTTQVSEVQLELGSTSTSYVEHQEQTKTLHLGDIELAKIGNYVDRIFKTSGKNLLDISKFEEHYTIDSNGLPVYNGGQTRLTNTTPINVGGIDKVTLTCTLNGKSFIYSLLKADNTLISRVVGNPSGTTITIGEAQYLYICFYDNATLSNITDAMLNEGSTALPYEPYGSDKWYIEKNNIEKDKDYLIAQVGQVDTITDYARIRVYLNNACISTPTGLCSHLKFEASYSGQSNHFYAQGNYAYLIVDKTLLSTIDVTGAKAYLNTLTGLKILYPLSTPTYTEITNESLLNELNELEKMMSYNGQTNISVTGSLPMILNVSALKGE